MHAGRISIALSFAVFLGCTSSAPAPPAAAVGDEDYLEGIVTAKPPDTPESLAAKQAQLEANLKLAEESAAGGDLDRAIGLLEDSVMLDARHRTVLLTLTRHLHERSLALEKEDPRQAFGLARQAGGYLRMLREAHSDFTADERKLLGQVLFDEARAYARANRPEDFSPTLSAALDAGFDDLARLQMEPDFEALRRDEKMSAVLQEAERRIKAQGAQRAE